MPIAAEMYYLYNGGGSRVKPPLVLVHGAGGSHLSWPAELRRLAGYRVYTPDLPGHGKSPGSGQQLAAAYAARLVDFLGELDMHQAIFVGHSLGGAVVLELALQHAQHVAGLVLLSAGATLDIPPDILQAASNQVTYATALEKLNLRIFGPQAKADLQERSAKSLAATRPGVLYGDLLACASFDALERVAEIHAPALVLCGAEDSLTPPHFAHYLAARIPGAQVQVLPGAGHMLMLEQPAAVATAVRKFLDGLAY